MLKAEIWRQYITLIIQSEIKIYIFLENIECPMILQPVHVRSLKFLNKMSRARVELFKTYNPLDKVKLTFRTHPERKGSIMS